MCSGSSLLVDALIAVLLVDALPAEIAVATDLAAAAKGDATETGATPKPMMLLPLLVLPKPMMLPVGFVGGVVVPKPITLPVDPLILSAPFAL